MKSSWYCSYVPNDRIVIHASKLATCAGLNPFEDAEEFKLEFLNKSTYISPDVKAEQEIESLPQAEKINKIRATTFSNASQVTTALEEIRDLPLSTAIKAKITKDVFCKHGTEQEPIVRSAIREKIKTSTRYKISSMPIATLPSGLEVYIGGKHDGIKANSNMLVEIKTRQNKFIGVRDYELVQVHAYMTIFDKRNAELVESFLGNQRTHAIKFDDAFWGKVTDGIVKFFTDLEI